MKGFKIGGVLLVSVIITTLAIDASDTLSGKGGTLLASLSGIENSVCPNGMIEMESVLTFTCVDEFEASASSDCLYENPSNQFDTEANLKQADCRAVSLPEKNMWRNITREQAMVMCTRSGKRLPDANEWYQFALGTPPEKCNINNNGIKKSNSQTECVSASGVKDTVGNVWEWVSTDVINGVYKGRNLPESGYVKQVDSEGVAIITSINEPDDLFDQDYFWSDKEGVYAMIRGGFYGSRSDAGVYSIHAETSPTLSGQAIGFRCVK